MAWNRLRAGWPKVNQLHHRIGLARDLVAVDLSLQEQGLRRLVRFEQGTVGLAQDLVAQIVELAIGEPRLAARGEVDRPNRLTENPRQNPLTEPVAQARRRIGRDEALPLVDGRPSQPVELIEKRLLDVEVFRHGRRPSEYRRPARARDR